MATSGSYNYGLTAGEIIQAAYEDLGMATPGQTLTPADTAMALRRLNMIVKQYQGQADGAQGMKIHTRNRITLVLQKGQSSYLIGPAATDARASAIMGRTTLTAQTVASSSDILVAASTDTTSYPGTTFVMDPGDSIGIQLDNGYIHWSTVQTVLSVNATVTEALPYAASSGNYVWWFTARAQRFPVLEAIVARSPNFEDSALEVYTDVRQYEYGVSAKLTYGTPTAVLVEPLRNQTRLTLNSLPTDVTQTLLLTVLYPSEDYNTVDNDIAYPQEAMRFLSWELAFALSPAFGRWTKEMEGNRQEARAMYLTLNPENTILHFLCGGE